MSQKQKLIAKIKNKNNIQSLTLKFSSKVIRKNDNRNRSFWKLKSAKKGNVKGKRRNFKIN